jgi:hypothetical protein
MWPNIHQRDSERVCASLGLTNTTQDIFSCGVYPRKTSGHSISRATEGGLEKHEGRSGVRRETGYDVTCNSLKVDFVFCISCLSPYLPHLAESLALMRGKSGC